MRDSGKEARSKGIGLLGGMKPYYEEDGITIYHGDCREILPELEFDAWFADPPYGVGLKARSTKNSIRYGSYNDFQDTPENVVETCVPVVRLLSESGKPGALTPGAVCAYDYPRPKCMSSIYYPAGAGLCAWGFTCSQPLLFYGKCPYLANGLGSRPNATASSEASEVNGHPCPKPIGLMKWVVNRISLPGWTICDPFMGSGTTLVAAKMLGRKAIGIEIEEKYCEIAVNRLAQKALDFSAA